MSNQPQWQYVAAEVAHRLAPSSAVLALVAMLVDSFLLSAYKIVLN